MNDLTYSQTEQGLEIVILNSGEAFCTQSSYSRWTGVDRTTIVKRCGTLEILEITSIEEPVNFFTGLIKTQINAGLTGKKEVVLIPAKIMGRWLAKDNPDLHDEMLDAGATQFLYTLAGYQLKAVQVTSQQEQPKQLNPIENAEKILSVAERYKNLFGTINPTIEQHFKDLIGNSLIELQPQLEGKKELWMGVVNFAEVELGYTVPTKGEYRNTALGKWMRFYHPDLTDSMELRLCNETNQEIWVYPIHECREGLTQAVHNFFNHPAPGTKLKNDGAFKRPKPQE